MGTVLPCARITSIRFKGTFSVGPKANTPSVCHRLGGEGMDCKAGRCVEGFVYWVNIGLFKSDINWRLVAASWGHGLESHTQRLMNLCVINEVSAFEPKAEFQLHFLECPELTLESGNLLA